MDLLLKIKEKRLESTDVVYGVVDPEGS